MVIRVVSLPDSLDLPDFDEVFRAILGWDGLGFSFAFTARSSTSSTIKYHETPTCNYGD
jgi:hypothetical protein